MSSSTTTPDDDVLSSIKAFAVNFFHKHLAIFDNMSSTRWVRMLLIVGAYLLFRPFLVKLGERIQGRQYAQQTEERRAREEEEERRPKAKISPNALRGHVIGEVDDDGELVGEVKPEGGKKARRRQKKVTIQEGAGQGEGEGHTIDEAELMDHLVDYVEGEDGW